MKEESLDQLRQVGLTEGELRVYEALLKIGESTKTNLVKEAGIAPANLYDITNKLQEKGIISIVEKNGKKHFSAAHPRHLLDFIEEKKKNIAKEEKLITTLLPKLTALFTEQQTSAKIEIFTGWNGLKTIFEDLLEECQAGEQNYVYGAAKGENEKRADRFFLKYSRMRARKGIMLNIIFNEELRERQERINFFKNNKSVNIKFLQQTTNTEFMLYKDVVTIIILAKDPITIRIRDKNVFDSFKQHFDILWQLA